jgi:FKBP-type peptidyl-prolyl cis-trans isomerase/alpha-tubulin suppressor-like RCC1 family protein
MKSTQPNSEENLPGTIDFVIITAGNGYHLGIASDGTLWAWGKSWYGGIGTGGKESLDPIQIGTDNKWIDVKTGYDHSLGLKSDGTLWSWGRNVFGQLGDGSVKTGKRKVRIGGGDTDSPAQIGEDTNWIGIAAGGDHSLALKSDGSIWGWGDNSNGQLGDRNLTNYTFDFNDDVRDGRIGPGQIGGDNDWISIATGSESSYGIKSDDTLWASGSNIDGNVGDGSHTKQEELIKIGTDTNWKSVSAKDTFCLAIKSDGSMWAWGNNYSGELGTGTTENENKPVQIGKDFDWVNVAVGENCYGLKSDGSLWEWGNNQLVPLKKNISKDDPRIHLKADGGLWIRKKNNISDAKPKEKNKAALQEIHRNDNSQTIKTASGLEYTITRNGNGTKPKNGDKVVVHYTGRLTNNIIFDSSVKRGTPFSFKLGAGEVIKGWDEAVLLMQVGDKATIKFGPELGYGDRSVGPIPANSTLIFDVELVDVLSAAQKTNEDVYMKEDDVDGETTACLISGHTVDIAADKLEEVTSVIAKWRTKTNMPLYGVISHRRSVIGLLIEKAYADDGAPEGPIDKEKIIKTLDDAKKISKDFWTEIDGVSKSKSSILKEETKLLLCSIGPLASAYLASGKLISNEDKNAESAVYGCDMHQEPHSTGVKGKWIVKAEDWNIEEVILPKKIDGEIYLIARYD